CKKPGALKEDTKIGSDATIITSRHKILTDLMVMAVACDQTRVFNMSYGGNGATKSGFEKPAHTATHEEPWDTERDYHPTCSWFTRRAMENWAYYVKAFADFKEGDGSLLDNVLIVANSDHGLARIHALDGMALFTAGKAGGKVKTGLHIDGGSTAATRLG